MNNFFKPQATLLPTLTNFETGETYSTSDIFRNLFRQDVTTTLVFGSADEWELENDLKLAINSMLFDTYYAVGTTTKSEPSKEDLSRFRKERAEVVEFLLYNKEESPLYEFKKTFRRFLETKEFCEDGLIQEHKGLNLEKLEEFLGIQISSEIAEYSDRFFVSGQSGDWYMSEFGKQTNSSICFEDTQVRMLVRFIRRVLNVQEDATDRATMRFNEGFSASQVAEELTNAYGVERIINKALNECNKTAKTAVCHKCYGTWVVDFKSAKRHDVNTEVFEFDNQQIAREYANAKNVSERCDNLRAKNIDKIAELKAELAKCLELTDNFDNSTDEATAELLKAQKLARPLQAS